LNSEFLLISLSVNRSVILLFRDRDFFTYSKSQNMLSRLVNKLLLYTRTLIKRPLNEDFKV